MLPQHYEFADELPLTLTGKVDANQLRTRELTRDAIITAPKRKLSQRESLLAQVWKEVLALDTVEDEDDFFDLGGDSFAVIEASAAAEARGLRLPPSLLIKHSKFADLARALSGAQIAETAGTSGAIECQRSASRRGIVCRFSFSGGNGQEAPPCSRCFE